MVQPSDLYATPNALAPHYSRFQVDRRLLLTGHSHQAWSDCGFEAQQQAWLDAAEHVDDKWTHAMDRAARVRAGFTGLMDDSNGLIALGQNTHELVVRFLSALPLRERPRLVTTDGEFHTIRRQLDRLAEEGLVEVVKVAALPAVDLAAKLVAAVNDRTAAVLVSSVLYQNAHIVPNLGEVLEACQRVGAELLVDAYHALNVLPFSIARERLEGAFVVGGGYKYCQLGEGNCCLRFPRDGTLRPVLTGWYSEFSALSSSPSGTVAYGEGPDRFAGATYDPTSHYRAAVVFDFFAEQSLTPALLREVSQHQIGVLMDGFDALDLPSAAVSRDTLTPRSTVAGFLALTAPRAGEISTALRARGVYTDYRGETLRLGPAPYLTDQQLEDTMEALGQAVAG